MRLFGVVVLMAMVLLLTGCPPKPVQLTGPVPGGGTQVAPRQEDFRVPGETLVRPDKGGVVAEDITAAERAARERAERERVAREKALEEAQKKAPFTDILFDFDSYVISANYMPKLKQIGDWLVANRQITIVLEGHCDERGTAEYNLALGQRRAEAVKEYLVKAGVEARRINAVSYGKEVPVAADHTEEAWTKNRRVNFRIDRQG